jgi:xylulokinase
MGVMLSAGGSLRWLRDILFSSGIEADRNQKIGAYDIMTRQAAQAAPGSEGLIFLPYLTGERTPYADPDARGVFFGLSLRHHKAHLVRAVMEGVAFGLLDSLNLLRRAGIRVRRVRISGGGGRSDSWRQMISDIFDLDIETVNITEGAAYGSALLAGVGCGIYPNVQAAVNQVIRTRLINKPGSASRIYKDYYRRYRSLYSALALEFKEMTKVVDKRSEVKDNQETGR